MNFILRWLALAVATAAAIWLIPGIYPIRENGYIAVALFALAFSLINVIVKPIAKALNLGR